MAALNGKGKKGSFHCWLRPKIGPTVTGQYVDFLVPTGLESSVIPAPHVCHLPAHVLRITTATGKKRCVHMAASGLIGGGKQPHQAL
ncbi:hypothetical protein N7466_011064 [Penicillium verhagenii]|uniref:uncharacterized protein n=1 Tax=Penicillium verhagenii TaxID=1562060 RepID=UPI0025459AA9|nr:uncharacterized protein N7466_011064 [Penicillium verhagenii]KAJ5917510.1 hypothetical protein N7466_011064 [Penicillium verhagenii]